MQSTGNRNVERARAALRCGANLKLCRVEQV
jgi:hypothetical protein